MKTLIYLYLSQLPGAEPEILGSAPTRVQAPPGAEQPDNREAPRADKRGPAEDQDAEEGEAGRGVRAEEQDDEDQDGVRGQDEGVAAEERQDGLRRDGGVFEGAGEEPGEEADLAGGLLFDG